ncbi:MAG: hypothetical protein NZM10_00910 [Fimbriimonadales bacterium]|nr:hypothetical protein [Fimbriimonadales bacterium]
MNVYRALQAVGGGSNEPALSSIVLNPARVVGGNRVTGTVNLTAPAPAGGMLVRLSHNAARRLALIPSHIAVPEGATSATFTIRTTAGGLVTTVTITATHGETSRSAQLTIWL